MWTRFLQRAVWLPFFVPTKQQFTRLNSFNRLIWVFRQLMCVLYWLEDKPAFAQPFVKSVWHPWSKVSQHRKSEGRSSLVCQSLGFILWPWCRSLRSVTFPTWNVFLSGLRVLCPLDSHALLTFSPQFYQGIMWRWQLLQNEPWSLGESEGPVDNRFLVMLKTN